MKDPPLSPLRKGEEAYKTGRFFGEDSWKMPPVTRSLVPVTISSNRPPYQALGREALFLSAKIISNFPSTNLLDTPMRTPFPFLLSLIKYFLGLFGWGIASKNWLFVKRRVFGFIFIKIYYHFGGFGLSRFVFVMIVITAIDKYLYYFCCINKKTIV